MKKLFIFCVVLFCFVQVSATPVIFVGNFETQQGAIEFTSEQSLLFTQIGDIGNFTAIVKDYQGNIINDGSIIWSLSDNSLLSLNTIDNRSVAVNSIGFSVSTILITAYHAQTNSTAVANIILAEITNKTHVLNSEDVISGQTPLSGTQENIILQRNSNTEILVVNDFVVTGVHAGLLIKIDQISLQANEINIVASEATFTDVFINLQVDDIVSTKDYRVKVSEKDKTIKVYDSKSRLLVETKDLVQAFVCVNSLGNTVGFSLNDASLDFNFKVENKVKLIIEQQSVKEFSIVAKSSAKIGATTGGISMNSALVGDIKCSVALPGLASPPLIVYGVSFQLAASPKIGFDLFTAFSGPNASFTGPTGIITTEAEVGIRYDPINSWAFVDTFKSDYKFDVISGVFDTNINYAFSVDVYALIDLQLKASIGLPPLGVSLTDFTFLEVKASEVFDMTIESPFDFRDSNYVGPIGGLNGQFTVTPKATLSGGALAELLKKLDINTSVNLTITPIINYNKAHWHTPEPIIIGPNVIDVNSPADFSVSTANNLNTGDFAVVSFKLPVTTSIGEIGFLGDIDHGYGGFQWAAVPADFGAFDLLPRVTIDSLSQILPYANAVEKQITVIDSHSLLIADVSFPDSELQTCIDNMTVGRTYVYELTFIQCNQNVSDLSGLEFFTELTYLALLGGQITNINQIASLTKLTTLNLHNHEITNISALAGLSNLDTLSLARNNIEDITPLSNLGSLQSLDLDQNLIVDYSALSSMTNLELLLLNENLISTISSISSSINLQTLELGYNNIVSTVGIASMPQLVTVNLSGNQISNLTGVSTLGNLIYLYLDANEISDTSSLSTFSQLELLYLDDNNISDVSSLASLTSLNVLRIQNNNNLIPCSQIDALSFVNFLSHDIYYDVDNNGVFNQPPDISCSP